MVVWGRATKPEGEDTSLTIIVCLHPTIALICDRQVIMNQLLAAVARWHVKRPDQRRRASVGKWTLDTGGQGVRTCDFV